MKQGRDVELPEDFWIPIPLETNNITSLSPFLVPQDHLASSGVYYAMALYMLFIFIVGTFINALTVTCTRQTEQEAQVPPELHPDELGGFKPSCLLRGLPHRIPLLCKQIFYPRTTSMQN